MTIKKIDRMAEVSLVLMFILAIGAPVFAGLIFPPSDVSSHENRALAKFPHFQLDTIDQFKQPFEGYLNDHFLFRHELIRGNEYMMQHIFRATSNNYMIIGRDGWLYYRGGESAPYYSRTSEKSLNDTELEMWRCAIEQRTAYFRERGMTYVLFIAPDKETVYPEFMPQPYSAFLPHPKIGQLMRLLENETDLIFIWPKDVLMEKKQDYPLYYQTDSHWNSIGAFFGYQELLARLQGTYPEIEIPEEYQFLQLLTIGDLNLDYISPEERTYIPLYKGVSIEPVSMSDGNLSEYPFSLKKRKTSPYSALVIGDSYLGAMQQFFIDTFDNVSFKQARSGEFARHIQEMDRDRPDIVIEIIVERSLNTYVPHNPEEITERFPCTA